LFVCFVLGVSLCSPGCPWIHIFLSKAPECWDSRKVPCAQLLLFLFCFKFKIPSNIPKYACLWYILFSLVRYLFRSFPYIFNWGICFLCWVLYVLYVFWIKCFCFLFFYRKWDLLGRQERLQLEKCSGAQKLVTPKNFFLIRLSSQIFSPVCGLSFNSHNGVFHRSKMFNFSKAQFIIFFSIMDHAWCYN
jgi:hypothetical protein